MPARVTQPPLPRYEVPMPARAARVAQPRYEAQSRSERLAPADSDVEEDAALFAGSVAVADAPTRHTRCSLCHATGHYKTHCQTRTGRGFSRRR